MNQQQANIPYAVPCVYLTIGNRTCIVYEETRTRVSYIAMGENLEPRSMDREKFHAMWKPIQGGYSPMKAATIYLNSLLYKSEEAKSILERIVKMENPVATTAAPAASEKPQAPAKKAAPASTKNAPPGVKPKAAAPAAKKAEAKPAGKKDAKAEKAAPAKKAAAGRSSNKFTSDATIKLLKGHETKKFQEGSVRSQVFAKIKDGMTVGAVVKACAKFADEKVVIACLAKLQDTTQKQPTIAIK